MTPVTEIKIGDRVRFRRGGGWLEGQVIKLGRSVAYIRSGDDFLGYETFVENLKLLNAANSRRPSDGN